MTDLEPAVTPVTVRSHLRPGDIGHITALHGVLYATEYGWDYSFEAYVAEHLGAFGRRYGAASRECIWIAERKDEMVGCIAIVESSPDVAHLRWFLVTPDARGSGLGRTLLHHAIDFSRDAGYRKIILDTVSSLTAAARLYVTAGFRLATETRSAGWGSEVTEQRYELDITPTAESEVGSS